jgi:hypothetical protein
MFLTTAELAICGPLGGVVLGGVISWVVARATAKANREVAEATAEVNREVAEATGEANRRKDRDQRIWERTADLYEQVLVYATAWAATRDNLMRTYRLSGPGREIPTLDDADRARLGIRLQMFGASEVQDAFRRYSEARGTWAGCNQALQDAYDQNDKVRAGDAIQSDLIPDGEIRRKVAERKAAAGAANDRETELVRAVQEAVRRMTGPTTG